MRAVVVVECPYCGRHLRGHAISETLGHVPWHKNQDGVRCIGRTAAGKQVARSGGDLPPAIANDEALHRSSPGASPFDR
jgi:hypothetical protein